LRKKNFKENKLKQIKYNFLKNLVDKINRVFLFLYQYLKAKFQLINFNFKI